MNLNEKRRRRRHSAIFKSEAVAACQVAGASVSGVALQRQLNANVLRRWIKEAQRKGALVKSEAISSQEKVAAFVPVTITGSKPTAEAQRPIRVQVRKRGLRVTIEWPASVSGSCAAWLRELLG
jgi:transposase-like protein